MLRRSSLLIAGLWFFAIFSALTTPMSPQGFPEELPLRSFIVIVALPPVFFSVMAFWADRSPFYVPWLARFVDSRYGANSFDSFLVRLRPLLLFALSAILSAGLALWRQYQAGARSSALTIEWFFVSGGVAFALAHLILYKRRVIGVYPTWRDDSPADTHPGLPQEPLPLREALPKYWWTLIGVALFPTFAAILEHRVPFEYLAFPFFAVMLLAAWPVFSKRATYAFWLVVVAVWMAGGILMALLGSIANAFHP